MIVIKNKTQCTGCTACLQICTRHAIKLEYDQVGHSYPVVDIDKCIECGLCEKVCPMLHKEVIPKDENQARLPVYVVYNKDSEVRSRSTSGGVFTALSEQIINDGGIVFAARFDENYHVVHDSFESMDKIEPYRGSKYVQSDLSDIFFRIKEEVRKRKVLFIGSPCQVAGLKMYLRKEFDNLYTCDFICMGISSAKHWREYFDTMWKGKKVKRIFFKDKREGWHNWRMLVEYEDGEYLKRGAEDPFFYGYVKKLTMRPSCSCCPFRTCRRISDITIADGWGVDKVKPEFDDDRGCSTIILQNSKAERLFEEIKDSLNVIPYSILDVIKYNPFIITPINLHPEIRLFEKIYPEMGFVNAVNMCKNRKPNLAIKLYRKIKSYYEKKYSRN